MKAIKLLGDDAISSVCAMLAKNQNKELLCLQSTYILTYIASSKRVQLIKRLYNYSQVCYAKSAAQLMLMIRQFVPL